MMMKCLVSVVVLLLAIQATFAEDVTTTKTCKDFFSEETCENLVKLIGSLKEASSTLQDAINAGVKAHIQTSKDMLEFVKAYIASKIQCEAVMTQDMCTVLDAVATQLKLTKDQVKMAIEMAYNTTKITTKEIYQRTLNFLTQDIVCEKIFVKQSCDNMLSALDKFHEQRSLLKEAILSVAVKHYQNTKMVVTMVQTELVNRIKNFSCQSVLPDVMCTKLADVAARLKIAPAKLKEAIELVVIQGISTTAGIYDAVITFLTEKINCANILTPVACQNLLEATKKLHEQRKLIQEAIMTAALDKISDVHEIYKDVRDKLIEKAVNFQCTDVLTQFKCDLLKRIAGRFHVRATELKRILVEAVVNGTQTSRAIYAATIGAMLEEAKNLTCADLLPESLTVCKILTTLAQNLRESASDVNDAVRRAIAQGLTTVSDIKAFVKDTLVDQRSCQDVLRSWLICRSLRIAAAVKGVTYDRLISKIRELFSNGITTVTDILTKLKEWLKSDKIVKRSTEVADFTAQKNELVDIIMQTIGGIATITDKVKANIKAELKRLANAGKLKLLNIAQTVKDLFNKFNPLEDEFEDEVPADLTGMAEVYKKARAMFLRAMEKIKDVARRIGVSQAHIKMIENMYKSGIQSINDAVIESL